MAHLAIPLLLNHDNFVSSCRSRPFEFVYDSMRQCFMTCEMVHSTLPRLPPVFYIRQWNFLTRLCSKLYADRHAVIRQFFERMAKMALASKRQWTYVTKAHVRTSANYFLQWTQQRHISSRSVELTPMLWLRLGMNWR